MNILFRAIKKLFTDSYYIGAMLGLFLAVILNYTMLSFMFTIIFFIIIHIGIIVFEDDKAKKDI